MARLVSSADSLYICEMMLCQCGTRVLVLVLAVSRACLDLPSRSPKYCHR